MNYYQIILVLILFLLLISFFSGCGSGSRGRERDGVGEVREYLETPPTEKTSSGVDPANPERHPEIINRNALKVSDLVMDLPGTQLPEEVYRPNPQLLSSEESRHFRDTEAAIINPEYLKTERHLGRGGLDYKDGVIQTQGYEIKKLKDEVMNLAKVIDNGDTDRYRDRFYKRSISNKYYPVRPVVSTEDESYLNLYDDDFSTKTLSTIKFLEQTQPSKFYGSEIHFPSELCGNFCPSSDNNVQQNEQIDVIRPINMMPKHQK